VEVEYLDAGLGGIEDAFVFVGTGHLALQTPGTLLGIDVQGLHHLVFLLRGAGCLAK
jgi:hypothetical protein